MIWLILAVAAVVVGGCLTVLRWSVLTTRDRLRERRAPTPAAHVPGHTRARSDSLSVTDIRARMTRPVSHKAPATPFTLEQARREAPMHRHCRLERCAAQRAILAAVHRAGLMTPDLRPRRATRRTRPRPERRGARAPHLHPDRCELAPAR